MRAPTRMRATSRLIRISGSSSWRWRGRSPSSTGDSSSTSSCCSIPISRCCTPAWLVKAPVNQETHMSETSATAGSALAPTAPLPPTDVLRYDAAPPERRAEIEQVLAELRMDDSNSIVFFGTGAQDAVTAVADEMLEGVRNKDTGAAGDALNEMVTTLRGLPVRE